MLVQGLGTLGKKKERAKNTPAPQRKAEGIDVVLPSSRSNVLGASTAAQPPVRLAYDSDLPPSGGDPVTVGQQYHLFVYPMTANNKNTSVSLVDLEVFVAPDDSLNVCTFFFLGTLFDLLTASSSSLV